MLIAAGVVLWIGAGVIAALLAGSAWRVSRASNALTVSWAALGAVIGGLIGVFPYLPERGYPWQPGALAGAFIAALCLAMLYRFVRSRSQRPPRKALRTTTIGALGTLAAALASASWFLLDIASPRLYTPPVHPDLPIVIAVESLDSVTLRSQVADLARIYLSRPENAGIAIGVTVAGQRVVVTDGVAYRNGDAVPIDGKSLFEIGSVTKAITGIALADAIVAGEVMPDQRVVELLGDEAPSALDDLPITLTGLATHSAGLPEYPAATPWYTALFTANPWGALSEPELIESVVESAQMLGESRYRYSNFGFVLLGYLLETRNGQSWSRRLDERVFGPLGMQRSRVIVDADPDGLVDGHALGRRMPHWTGHRFAGAAGVVSSANDMLTLLEAHLRPAGSPLRDALILATTDHGAAWGNRRIGFGWHIVPEDSFPRVAYHAGNTLGFYAWAGFSEETGAGVVVLGNSNDPTPAAIGARLLGGVNAAVLAQLAPENDSGRDWFDYETRLGLAESSVGRGS